MSVQSDFYTGTALEGRTFPSTKHIPTKAHMAVWKREATVTPPATDKLWIRVDEIEYQLINNSAVLNQKLSTTLYDTLEVRVADTPDELSTSQSDISIVAGIASEVETVAGIANEVETVASISTDVSNVSAISADVTNVSSVSTDVSNVSSISADVTNVSSISTDVTTVSGISTDVTTVAGVSIDVPTVASVSTDIPAVASVSTDIPTVAGISTDIPTVAGISTDVTTVAGISTNVVDVSTDPLRQSILDAGSNATTAQLQAWEAEARKMTSDSYATEPEDTFVKVYTSNGDGTFTATDTTEYSSLHWAAKATNSVVLDALSDVTITNPQANEALTYNPTTNEWVNGEILGLPDETGKAYHNVSTEGVKGDSFWTPFHINPSEIVGTYTIKSGSNAMVAGSITIPVGSSITVELGAEFTVV